MLSRNPSPWMNIRSGRLTCYSRHLPNVCSHWPIPMLFGSLHLLDITLPFTCTAAFTPQAELGSGLKAHVTDEQDKTPKWLLQANQWPNLVLKLGLLFQSSLFLTVPCTECRDILIPSFHYYSSKSGLRAGYLLNNCNQPQGVGFIIFFMLHVRKPTHTEVKFIMLGVAKTEFELRSACSKNNVAPTLKNLVVDRIGKPLLIPALQTQWKWLSTDNICCTRSGQGGAPVCGSSGNAWVARSSHQLEKKYYLWFYNIVDTCRNLMGYVKPWMVNGAQSGRDPGILVKGPAPQKQEVWANL